MEWLLKTADIFFLVFHTVLTLFNFLGWIWKKTRKINLITLSLTGASWFILGLFYGIGYCPLTDWHFQVLHELGHYDLPSSYIQYLVERLIGLKVQADIVDLATAVGFFIALVLSIVFNLRDRKRKGIR
ncbi:MAG: DUF2784 domain-containing protein [Bacteroidales bacterium]